MEEGRFLVESPCPGKPLNLLLLASAYPHAGDPLGGIFNQRCATVLKPLCGRLEVLAPRPYAPPVLGRMSARYRVYSRIARREDRGGLTVIRPAYVQVPRWNSPFWTQTGTHVSIRGTARRMHCRARFDAILSFDLISTGGLAWRLGQDLDIPAAGWATGGDVRASKSLPYTRALLKAIDRLQLVFYQSRDLLNEVAGFLGVTPEGMAIDRHVVLARGVPVPPRLPKQEVRNRLRREWGLTDQQIIVLSVGRIARAKGAFELFEAISLAAARDSRVTAVWVGSRPALDETEAVEARLHQIPGLRDRLRILPACSPERVWEHLCAADIFAFPSHAEGMPNSLLEAMAMEIPSIAFAIPPVNEIDAGTGALVLVPPLDTARFADEIVRLASDRSTRVLIGQAGEAQVRKRFDVTRNMATAFSLMVEMRARWMASRQ
jgi:teichuronic acid biosynthesis glycosyltransferase TuaC